MSADEAEAVLLLSMKANKKMVQDKMAGMTELKKKKSFFKLVLHHSPKPVRKKHTSIPIHTQSDLFTYTINFVKCI